MINLVEITYRKDCVWPYVNTLPLRMGPDFTTKKGPEGLQGPVHCASYEWSRQAPTGPLMEPVMYRAKVGPQPDPATETCSCQQRPNISDLEPEPQKPPFKQLKDEEFKKLLRSTYQIDYCKKDEILPDDYFSKLHCSPGVRSVQFPGRVCVPPPKDIHATSLGFRTRRTCCWEERPRTMGPLPPVCLYQKPEYKDGFNRMGGLIMGDKLHQHGGRVPGKLVKINS
uniref:Uncharacterized protein n=1 Tax=Timema bartmani TaxID=61472 RepID=A0A7R9F5Z9_9NEOP|nr:unnamed protein product [Timema bartmani]